MSVTINTTPYAIAPVGKNNPVAFAVTGSNRVATPGVARALSIVKSGSITNGATIVFAWGNYSLTFTFTTSYALVDTGLALHPTMDAAAMAAALRLNYLINRDFIISVYGSTITFTAKATGTTYQLEITLPTGMVFGTTDTDAVDEVLNSNYKIFAQLNVEETWGSGTFTKKTELFADANASGEAEHYFENVLSSMLRDKCDVPTFGQTTQSTASNVLRKYSADFAEIYGDTPTVQKLYSSGTYYALNGELSTDQWPSYDFIYQLGAKKFFLTNRPQKLETWKTAHQYLSFMNYLGAATSFWLRLKVYLTDGTTQSTIVRTFSLAQYETTMIPVGYNQLALDAMLSGDEAYMYEIWISPASSDDVVMRPMRFILQEKPFFSRFFIFQNKLAGIDTLLCADQATTRNIEKEQRNAFVPYNYAKADGMLKSDVTNSYETHSITSVLLRKEEAEAALEIVSSRHVYLAGASGYIRVDVEGGEIKTTDEASDLFYIEFNYRYSLQASDAFIKPNGDYSNDYSTDFDI